jgi:glycogenin glucosyltransferase
MDNDIELNKLVLQCENEDTRYLSPEKMTDSEGKNIYAYVCLVMLGDLYISAAIVLAQSLINCGSKADRVVLVTPDVTEEGKKILQMYFNKVLVIDYVNVSNWRVKKQPQRKYLDLVFTKFHVFNLVEYKKIILIDADAIVLKFPDHIFSLESPAGCLLEDKNSFISYNNKGDYVFPSGPIGWYEKFCKLAPHGEIIPKEITDKLKTEFQNSGVGGGLMLLTPKLGEFDEIIRNVSFGFMKHLVENKFPWPEQQYLTLRYSGKWHQINPRFFGLQGYPHWKVLYGLQYGGDKPFVLNSKMPMEERVMYDDYILWHDIYREILNSHPEFLESKVLEEANKMAANFMKNKKMSRTKIKGAEISYLSTKYDEYYTKYNLNNIYQNTPVHNTQQQYYYSDRFSTYSTMDPKIMFDDIAEYEYIKPIQKLSEIYGPDSYYAQILNYVQVTKEIPLYKYNYFEHDMRDAIMLEYAKCRPDMFVLTLWPLANNNTEKVNSFIKYLESVGSVPYVKTVSLNKNAIKNLMFWMYNEFNFQAKLDFIKEKLSYANVLDENNSVTFIFFDNIKKLKISGQNAPDKRVLRDKLLKELGLHDDKNIRGNDVLHINDFFYQTVEYAQMILNKNTLELLANQDVNRLATSFFSNSNLKMQTFRKFIYSNFSLLDINRIVIIGGVLLYAYGIRVFTDIDSIFTSIGKDNTEYEKYLESIIFDNCIKKDTKIKFVDLNKENSSHWRETLTEKNQKIFDENNIKSTIDLITNPRHHLYFQGIKIYTMGSEIIRKFLRIRDSNSFNREKDLMDLTMINLLNDGLISGFVTLDKNSNELVFNDKYNKVVGESKIKLTPELINKFKKEGEKYYLRADLKALVI